jgi:CHAT domain-containing protein
VEHARVWLEQGSGTTDGRALTALQSLYALLVQPVEAYLGPAETPVLIVPDPLLEGVPFAALHDARRGRYLVQDHPLRILPTLRERRRPPASASMASAPALLVAATEFDRTAHPELEALPGAAAEVRALARYYPNAAELAGAAATRDAVLAGLPRARIIHFAGHALFDDQNPGRSRLVLSAGRGTHAPAELAVAEIERMRVRPEALVVLSACQTVRATPGRSGGFAGLAGAFLAAGGGGVVGSLWNVDDEQTRILMTAFHEAYRTNPDGAAALRKAQLRMIGGPDGRTRAPGSWAGFRYTGY